MDMDMDLLQNDLEYVPILCIVGFFLSIKYVIRSFKPL